MRSDRLLRAASAEGGVSKQATKNPDKPHAFRRRRVTWEGRDHYQEVTRDGLWVRDIPLDAESPCDVCGGSEFSPNHWSKP